MNEKVFDEPIRKRGISITGFVVESVTLDDESNKKIDNYELSSNTFMQQGTLTGSYADALKDAANNPNGAVNGMMGVGMVNMASNGAVNSATAGAFAAQAPGVTQQDLQGAAVTTTASTGTSPKFCPECGSPTNGRKFCANCGNKLA